mmetsp:Transcript_5282/g.10250  ORF Transcript_5282/g.10250 Transcript_5282/m.10250 type:complete len:430 (+) Transcript_5282:136-1425(+)
MKPLTLALAFITFALTHITLTAIHYGGDSDDDDGTQIKMSPRLSGRSLTAAQTTFIRDLYNPNNNNRRLRPEMQPQFQEQLQEQQQSQQESTTSSSSQSQSQSQSQLQSQSRPSLCSCSPRSFSISLDLSHNCDDNTVKKNSGIAFTICSIEVFDNIGNIISGGDPIPTVITSVTLIEINSVGTVINVDDQYTNVDFRTSSSFDLRSISSSLDPSESIEDQVDYVPSTAVLFMIGRNSAEDEEEEVIATFVWIYSNSCDGVTLNDGDVYSWNAWSGVEEQSADFCPANASGRPSAAPTASSVPTSSARPSDAPSVRPTLGPSAAPSLRPSSSPSGAPSGRPFAGPSSGPSEEPSRAPSSLPSSKPSARWSDGPSSRPSSVPSIAPSTVPSTVPSIILTRNSINQGSSMVSIHRFCLLLILYLTFRLGVY